VRNPEELRRIRALVIPPAWMEVWICPSPFGHLQAVGRDARGRKQYRYHPQYRHVRDEAKFGRMIAFSAAVARIRKRVAQDLERPGLPREKVVAAVVRLLDTTYARVGNDEYAEENDSFGLTTLKDRHAKIEGATVRLRFRGKSGIEQSVELNDRKLARIIRQCRDLPGYELFQYVNEAGEVCRVDSADVNAYLREITGESFSAKDFRTWAGTILGARELVACGPGRNERECRKKVVDAVKRVAAQLGNRPATCRKYYIHPAVVEAYAEGTLFDAMRRGVEQNEAYRGSGLTPEEYSAVVIVAAYQAKQGPRRKGQLRAAAA
jgi:DNA topoisomerase-1